MAALDLDAADRRVLGTMQEDLHAYVRGCDDIVAEIGRDAVRSPRDADRRFSPFKLPAQRIEANAAALQARAGRRRTAGS